MVLRSIAILLVGAALGTGLQYVWTQNGASPSVGRSGISSKSLDRESIVAATAESSPVADELPPVPALTVPAIETADIEATCAGSMNANGMECDYGLTPPALTAATKSILDRSPEVVLAEAGAAIVNTVRTAQSAVQQTYPENPVVGCAGGADATGNDCM